MIMNTTNPMQGVYFISGIDTDIGKSIATGMIARRLQEQGVSVITQKLIQTGSQGISDDIITHRSLMGVSLQACDECGETMPVLLPYPASPHLASRLADVSVDLVRIEHCTTKLLELYSVVLLEGAGGLLVPLTDDEDGGVLTIDYVARHDYPIILVTSGRLGSINHTLLSLESIKNRNIRLHALVYNEFHDDQDVLISADTKRYLQNHLNKHFGQTLWWTIPAMV